MLIKFVVYFLVALVYYFLGLYARYNIIKKQKETIKRLQSENAELRSEIIVKNSRGI